MKDYDDIITSIFKKEEEKQRKLREVQKWGIQCRNKLVYILEINNVKVSDWMYDALLFNISELICDNGKNVK